MFQVTIIGHLGANAEAGSKNGHSYVRFRVATSRNYVKADGTKVENTQWHSCIMSGDGGALLQYLRKGQLVCVSGNAELGVVSSPKLKRMVATSDVQVQSVELLGSAPDDMPRSLALPSGQLVAVNKCYFVSLDDGIKGELDGNGRLMFSADGRAFKVDQYGFISLAEDSAVSGQQEQAQQQQQGEQLPQQSVQMPSNAQSVEAIPFGDVF